MKVTSLASLLDEIGELHRHPDGRRQTLGLAIVSSEAKTFPKELLTKRHSTNPLEHLNKEIKWRTDVVGIFPNEAAIERLVGVVLLKNNKEWMTIKHQVAFEAIAKIGQPLIIQPAELAVAIA